MKKISTFLLLIVGFLFVGMFMPNTYAASNVTLNLNVITKGTEGSVVNSTEFVVPFGNTTTLNLSGLGLTGTETAIMVHNDQIVPTSTSFVMSASLNLSIIIKDNEDDHVAVFVDTNGELVDVVYNPLDEPSTSVSLSKPGYNSATFDTFVIANDTIFIAEYIKSNESSISVTINGGTKDLPDPKFNDIVTVTSTTPGFTHWVDEFGFVVSYDETFKFTALNSITLTAMTNGVAIPNIYLRDVSGIRENQESFYAKIYLPEGYELIEWGFIGSNTNANGQYQPTLTGENVSLNPNKSLNPATSEFLTTITGDGFAYTRAYATVYNNTTELYETIYSLVRNKILIDFQINYSWLHQFEDFSVLGAYVRGDFNGWSLDDKMNHSIENGNSVYKIRKPFIFIGSEMIQDFKYFIFVPLGWNPNDGWSYEESVSTSFRFRWYHVGNNITMTINPEDGTIQNAAQSPFNHY